MTFLMHSLSERFAQLGEETRLAGITELMNFTRNGQERIDDLITRFDTIRTRADQQGQLAISIQGLAWIILRACQVNDMQLMTLLQPFWGLFPADAAQYQTLCTYLRRMGHIIERAPGNIAAQLRSVPGHTGSGQAFFAGDAPTDPFQQPESDPWRATFTGVAAQVDHAAVPASPWSHQQPMHTPAPTYQTTNTDNDSDNGTDTDTVSSLGGDDSYDLPLPATASPGEVASYLFWAYQRAKGHWRNSMGKPVRAVRRFIRRKGKGKGKGKGKNNPGSAPAHLSMLHDHEVEQVFFGKSKGKGKRKGIRTSGKGKRRQLNPFGPDGQRMKCRTPGCEDEDHFERECPLAGQRRPANDRSFYLIDQSPANEGPLAGVLTSQETPEPRSVFMMTEAFGPHGPQQPVDRAPEWLPQTLDQGRVDLQSTGTTESPHLHSRGAYPVVLATAPPELPQWASTHRSR